jgi:tetratricopeptide (TPR) repeat protein
LRKLLVVSICLFACAAGGLAAQVFDADDWFGPALRKSDGYAIDLKLALRGPEMPSFTDTNASDGEPQYELGNDGLLLRPRAETTVAVNLDLAAKEGTFKVSVSQLEQDARLAWHLACPRGTARYLVEVHRTQRGVLLQMQVRGRNRFVQLPDAAARGELPDFPVTFELRLSATEMAATLGDLSAQSQIELPHGVKPTLAVTDARARVGDLAISAMLCPEWAEDAAARQAARRALERLVDFATAGLLHGVISRGYPDAESALEDYTPELRRKRNAGSPDKLAAVAGALPESALAQHEAGVAALLSGSPLTARRFLERAVSISADSATTQLALAESLRRTSSHARAQNLLDDLSGLPGELRVDAVLIRARILADRGELARAAEALAEAVAEYPEHEQLAAFHESAVSLTEASGLQQALLPGPLGLSLLTDVPADRLRPLLRRLEPYMQAIRDWLPDMPESPTGWIALYESPIAYLNAALLVAGDNLDNVAGMFLPAGLQGEPTVMACRGFGEDELLRTLVHELWHLALHSTGRSGDIPRWLDEGMAVYLSAARVVDGTLRFDRLPGEVGDFQGLLEIAVRAESIERALGAESIEFYQAGQVRVNYASAWAVVWYLARGSERALTLRRALGGDEESLTALTPEAEELAALVKAAVQIFEERK